MNDLILTNGSVVTKAEVFTGTVVIRDRLIIDVDRAISHLPNAIDLGGDYLIPGIIDLHTDNIEKHFFPRPRVKWPSAIDAVFSHDQQMVGAGITTVFDALSLGDYNSGGARKDILLAAINAISQAQEARMFRSQHLLHFRCEVSDPEVLSIAELHFNNPLLKLLSVMDHTPGQRQWRDLEIYRDYKRKRTGEMWSEPEFDEHLRGLHENQAKFAPTAIARVRAAARELHIPLASHDDTTVQDVMDSMRDGVTICEFPTTVEAAERARSLGMSVIMGAPNVVLGGSHSGNVSASVLAEEKLLNILTSDYVPSSLLQAAFLLARETVSLPEAIALITAKPANSVGLEDRGQISQGKKADLVRVRMVEQTPVVREVWRDGIQVVR